MPAHKKPLNQDLVIAGVIGLFSILLLVFGISTKDSSYVIASLLAAVAMAALFLPQRQLESFKGIFTDVNLLKKAQQTVSKKLKRTEIKSSKSKEDPLNLSKRFWLLTAAACFCLMLLATAVSVKIHLWDFPALGEGAFAQLYLKSWWDFFLTASIFHKALLLMLDISVLAIIFFVAFKERLFLMKHGVLAVGGAFFLLFSEIIGIGLGVGLTMVYHQQIAGKQAALLESNPGKLGFVLDIDEIESKLKDWEGEIVVSQVESLDDSEIEQIIWNSTAYSPFFTETLTRMQPVKQNYSLPDGDQMLLGSSLLFRELDEDSLEQISDELGHVMIREYLKPRNIKKTTSVDIISRQEYLAYRDNQINEIAEELETEVSQLGGQIASLRRQQDDVIIQYLQGSLDFESARNRFYSLENQIGNVASQQAELRQFISIVRSQKDRVPHELGIFLPEEDESIKIVLDTTEVEYLDDFIAILMHEFFHYTSYSDDEREFPIIFEEGLTEYFSRDLLLTQQKSETAVGYPIISKVMAALVKDLDQSKLQDAYFRKDEEMLAELINKTHGENFYEDSIIHLTMLYFLGFEDSVDRANDILDQLDAPQLDIDELRKELDIE